MIERLVLLGATGDLTARYLLPGLVALRSGGHIGDGFSLVAVGREDWRDEEFRNWAGAQLDQHAGSFSAATRDAILSASEYHRADVTDPAALTAVIPGAEPVAAYLALPPFIFAATVSALHGAGLGDGSSIVLEKPFGENLAVATELNTLLSQVFAEEQVFRVDHFLATTTVQNVLGTRLANRSRTDLEQRAHRRDRHRLGRDTRARGQGRILRRGRRVEGHAAEPLAAIALPRSDGAADQPRRP
jgi:glucose-6-phosphate 1-dehydrogenase